MKMKMKRSCSDKKSEKEEDSLNFVALHGVIESEKDITKGESRASCVSHTNSDASHSDTERDLDADFLADYQVLFGKFEELSHENMQLIKDKAILKAQVNVLEMEQTDTKGESKCRVTENDDKDEFQSLKRVITEQNRVQQDSEIKLHQMKQLLNQELEKNQLLERQLIENYKKVRMLNTGSATLDHILSIQQCPKISWGLGYQGSTSQEYGEAERIRFIKAEIKSDEKLKAAAQQVNKAKAEEKSRSVTKSKEIQDRKVIAKRRNGCHFCGQIGHSVAYCYARRNQLERTWRMNLFYVEPRRYGYVWISKKDLYPKFMKDFMRLEIARVFEGSLIRAIRRMEEGLQQLIVAAKSIGEKQLEAKLEEAVSKIKRDIIFAAPFYL
ncbi:hypothetical protein N665_0090s0002 [Sinapis alba]|nr:hypothetical protein N665_0090s0002 [Sinapis alba]